MPQCAARTERRVCHGQQNPSRQRLPSQGQARSHRLVGPFDVSHRLDRAIKNALNAPGAFGGEIVNRENIGKTADDLVALWNADHPDDPVV